MKRTASLIAWLQLLLPAAVLNVGCDGIPPEERLGEGTLELIVRDEDGDPTPAMVSLNTVPDGMEVVFGIDTMRAVQFRETHAQIFKFSRRPQWKGRAPRDMDGRLRLKLAEGEYEIFVGKGLEYIPACTSSEDFG